MKATRIRIAWLIMAVFLIALDLGVLRMVLGRNDRFNEEWLLGAMPMANVFVAFWLVRIRDPEWRRFSIPSKRRMPHVRCNRPPGSIAEVMESIR